MMSRTSRTRRISRIRRMRRLRRIGSSFRMSRSRIHVGVHHGARRGHRDAEEGGS